jgi:hypothetical protein
MRYTEPFAGSARFHRWAIISCIAALLERRCYFSLGGLSTIYPNQYIIICGGPGTGKSTTSNLAVAFIKQYNKTVEKGVFFGPDKTTPAALLKRFSKCTKSVPHKGKEEQHSPVFLHSTELATVIKDIGGGSMSDDLLKLYDCDDMFEKELVNQRWQIQNPCLNILADTTPNFLAGFLPSESSGTGLTARMIFATEPGRVPFNVEVPEGDAILRQKIILEVARIHRMNGEFHETPEARKFWHTWYPKHLTRMFTIPSNNFMRYFYARKPVHVRKVAMALAASENSSLKISEKNYEDAIYFIEEAEPFMANSFGVKSWTRMEDLPTVILGCMTKEKWMTEGEIAKLIIDAGAAGPLKDLTGYLAMFVASGLAKRKEGNSEPEYKLAD